MRNFQTQTFNGLKAQIVASNFSVVEKQQLNAALTRANEGLNEYHRSGRRPPFLNPPVLRPEVAGNEPVPVLPRNGEQLSPETIYVANAKNPFQEAFAEGGVESPAVENVAWNMVEICHSAMEEYQALELPAWSQELAGLENQLRNLSPEKKRIIEDEIKEGAIPMIMPGKRVQLATTLEQIKKLRPKFKNENGEETRANASFLDWAHLKQLIEQRNSLLVSDIPDGPYILLTKPTQKSTLTDKTVDEQIAAIAAMNENRPVGNKIRAMNLHEYAAAQVMRSKMIKKKSETDNVDLSQVSPMDSGGNTWTRFVSLPTFQMNSRTSVLVPFVRWSRDSGDLFFGNALVHALVSAGVRLSVRVEIGNGRNDAAETSAAESESFRSLMARIAQYREDPGPSGYAHNLLWEELVSAIGGVSDATERERLNVVLATALGGETPSETEMTNFHQLMRDIRMYEENGGFSSEEAQTRNAELAQMINGVRNSNLKTQLLAALSAAEASRAARRAMAERMPAWKRAGLNARGEYEPESLVQAIRDRRIGLDKLAGADLHGTVLLGVNLRGAILAGANFELANLDRVEISGANLEGANFNGAANMPRWLEDRLDTNRIFRVYAARGGETREIMSEWQRAGLNENQQYEVEILARKIRSRQIDVSSGILKGADLHGANLREADLKNAKLHAVDLSGANLYKAELSGANFAGANLIGAILDNTALSGTIFTRALLTGAHFDSAENILPDIRQHFDEFSVYFGPIPFGEVAGSRNVISPFESIMMRITALAGGPLREEEFERIEAELLRETASYPEKGQRLFKLALKSVAWSATARREAEEHRRRNQPQTEPGAEQMPAWKRAGLNEQGVYDPKILADKILMGDFDVVRNGLAGADLTRTKIINFDFSTADLRGAKFDHAVLNESDFSNTKLKGVSFSAAQLLNVSFDGADLAEVDFKNSDIYYATFKGAKNVPASIIRGLSHNGRYEG